MSVVLDNPTNGETGVGLFDNVGWHDTIIINSRDQWKVYLDGNLDTTLAATSSTGFLNNFTTGLGYSTGYTWYVEMWFEGGLVETSSTFSFTTEADPNAPLTLEHPAEDGTNYYLNKDWLLEMRWDDPNSKPIADHTLYFAASGDPEFIPRTDRTRYSIVAYKMFLDVELDYSTTYYWFVRKDLGGGAYVDSETWAFTTMAYTPPAYSTRERLVYGEDPGGDTVTVPSGENNMITVERLIAIAANKFFYEDV